MNSNFNDDSETLLKADMAEHESQTVEQAGDITQVNCQDMEPKPVQTNHHEDHFHSFSDAGKQHRNSLGRVSTFRQITVRRCDITQ